MFRFSRRRMTVTRRNFGGGFGLMMRTGAVDRAGQHERPDDHQRNTELPQPFHFHSFEVRIGKSIEPRVPPNFRQFSSCISSDACFQYRFVRPFLQLRRTACFLSAIRLKIIFMQIEWQSQTNESSYLFLQHGKWNGVRISRARVLPGKLLESAENLHKINISLAGSLTTEKITENGRRTVTKGGAGNICITPSGQSMGAVWNNTLDNLSFTFDPNFVAQTAVENRFSSNFEFTESYKEKDPLIQQIGLTLLEDAHNESPSGRLYADSLVQTLTLHLLKNYTSANAVSEIRHGGISGFKLRRVREFINANLEEDLSLAEIAEIADLSRFHFARSFRLATGQTPQQYLMQQRIERAKELLAKNELPIIEISLRTGFKNQSHFTTLFRKFTSLTPKIWRELKAV